MSTSLTMSFRRKSIAFRASSMSKQLIRIHLAILAMALLLPEALPQAPAARSQTAQGELGAQADSERRRRRPPDPFAGQKRIRALVITGGCCHDYAGETKILMDIMASEAPVDWTVMLEREGRSTWTRTKVRLYNQPNWSDGYDIVVHNECFANVDDAEFVRKIVAGHNSGLPAVVIHCSMHSYRALKSDEWREFLGVDHPPPHSAAPYRCSSERRESPGHEGIPPSVGNPDGRTLYYRKAVACSQTAGDRRRSTEWQRVSNCLDKRLPWCTRLRNNPRTRARDMG